MQKLVCFTGFLAFTYAEEASLFLVDEPISEIVDTMLTGPVANSNKAFDINSALSASTASCMKTAGYTTVIARAFWNGVVDNVGCTSLKTA